MCKAEMTTEGLYHLRREQWINRRLEDIFPFFERPENLAFVTPSSLDFRLMTPCPVRMEQGRIIDYTIKVFRLRTRWRSIISTYDPPCHFVDEQLIGPYSFWHHSHRFSKSGSGTIFIDEVHYALPLFLPRLLREPIHRLYVRPRLEKIFAYRKIQYENYFSENRIQDSSLSKERSKKNRVKNYKVISDNYADDISSSM